jgi:class 3 adenylate cyclase
MGKGVRQPLAIVAINYPPGFTETTFPLIQSLISRTRSAYAEYLPPATWLIYFKPRAAALAESLVAKIRELRAHDERFAAIGAAAHTGHVFYETGFWGRIKSPPLGDQVNVVLRAAAANAGTE